MNDADMNLHQWVTNSPALNAVSEKMGTGFQKDHAGLLGLIWNPKDDKLLFLQRAFVIPPHVKFTKWQVLSSASVTFDPLASLPLALFQPKHSFHPCEIRNLTRIQLSLKNYSNSTTKALQRKKSASKFVTTRYLDLEKTVSIEMHVFCDACPAIAAGCCILERLSMTFTANGKRETAGSCLS